MSSSTTHDKLVQWRQYAAIASAFTLPISTSGQNIAIAVFVVLALATLDRNRFAQTIRSPAAFLPVALFALLLLGILWTSAPAADIQRTLSSYAKLLIIPIVMATGFSRRDGFEIAAGFVAGCGVVAILSYGNLIHPSFSIVPHLSRGIPFKDNAVQSECMALAALILALYGANIWGNGKRRMAMAMFAVALLMFTNIFLIVFSKTGALVSVVVLAIFAWHIGGFRRMAALGICACLIIVAALAISPSAQQRLNEVVIDLRAVKSGTPTLSTNSRLDFWEKAGEFMAAAPVFGHGTGSIRSLYQSLEASRPSPYGAAVSDPHNQVLHTALQIGLVGAIVLIAMWAVHLKMLLGREFASRIGLAIVATILIGSLFNSHISQVTQGMLYCAGVGLCGALLRTGASKPEQQPVV